MQPAPARGVLIEMLRERTPVVGITIAVLVLLLEGVGLVAYQRHQRDVDARAAREAEAAKAKVHKLVHRASRIDRAVEELQKDIRELELRTTPP